MIDNENDCSSSEDEELLLLLLVRKKRRKPKQMWIRPIYKKRKEQGDYHNLLQELRLNDTESHFRYLKMSKERFDLLLSMVHHSVMAYELIKAVCYFIIIDGSTSSSSALS